MPNIWKATVVIWIEAESLTEAYDKIEDLLDLDPPAEDWDYASGGEPVEV